MKLNERNLLEQKKKADAWIHLKINVREFMVKLNACKRDLEFADECIRKDTEMEPEEQEDFNQRFYDTRG